MKLLRQRAGIFVLLALLLVPISLLAQEGEPVSSVGSGMVMPLFEAVVGASGTEINLTATTTGTNAGFEQFCQGQADITTANRAISTDEDTACTANSVDTVEILLAHQILAVIANPAADYAQCLTSANLNTIFAPSAQDQIINWNQVDVNNPDMALTVFVPQPETGAFATLDSLVGGDGLRQDATFESQETDIVAAVSQTNGAVGVVTLAAAEAAGTGVKILQLNTTETGGCVLPAADTVESRLYSAASQLFVYANRASLTKSGLHDVLAFAASDQAAAVIAEQGLTAPTTTAYATNLGVLEGTQERQFGRGNGQFQIPADLTGAITTAGAASGKTYLESITSAFNATYQGVTITPQLTGEPAGFRRLCNGEVDFVFATRAISDEQQQNCQANNITPLPVELGRQAAVLVANANSPYLSCLKMEQIATAWRAESGSTVTTWNQVSADFPETKMVLFAPTTGDTYADMLLLATAGTSTPIRVDTEINADVLYRAAAVANVEGGLTYMSWQDYQKVLGNNQPNIQLVSVDAGNGCVAPAPETIADGTYPLASNLSLIVSEAALVRTEVQSLLWFMFSDENYSLLEQAGLMGIGFGDLPAIRDTLLQAFERAVTVPEVTPEATGEATAEATTVPQATVEATTEVTAEATLAPQTTAEPTVETTPEATPSS
ncbi:MAG TPA: substrate-binding domain-containing protein [Phototrophicaceae bacterium]|nr:substrate-binding domain-containing protein [Phototrophicaceae bacterium]